MSSPLIGGGCTCSPRWWQLGTFFKQKICFAVSLFPRKDAIFQHATVISQWRTVLISERKKNLYFFIIRSPQYRKKGGRQHLSWMWVNRKRLREEKWEWDGESSRGRVESVVWRKQRGAVQCSAHCASCSLCGSVAVCHILSTSCHSIQGVSSLTPYRLTAPTSALCVCVFIYIFAVGYILHPAASRGACPVCA